MNILPFQQFKPVVGQNASYADGGTSHYSRVELMFARESPVSINCLCIFWTYEADFVRLHTFRSQVWRYNYDIMISSMTLWSQVWRYDMISSITLWSQVSRYDLKYHIMISSITLWSQVSRYDVMISSMT